MTDEQTVARNSADRVNGAWRYKITRAGYSQTDARNGIELDAVVRDAISRGFIPVIEVMFNVQPTKPKPTRISG